ncbi:Protein argonaute-2 [Portunus trituberculatus]|uniref:Protein argonaute-2 n=1 Tax=Portunus trituberculatus TaxID=210409 RepID=A0A5B7G8J8_PORTR|nr:Protein argonaute-2 [Portunus trituberculatus]
MIGTSPQNNSFKMLEVLFQHNMTVRYERIGRDRMFSAEKVFGDSFDIGGGKEALIGFFGSLRPVGWKENTMLLNVDGKYSVKVI